MKTNKEDDKRQVDLICWYLPHLVVNMMLKNVGLVYIQEI